MVWVVSGRDESELYARAARLQGFVAEHGDVDLADVGLSLAAAMPGAHRAAVVGRDRPGLLRGLAALAKGDRTGGLVRGVAAKTVPGVVFVFPGQGAQWAGMAVDLLASSPAFARRMAECDRALSSFVDWSVLDVVHGMPDAPPLERVDVVQPVLFAVMVSLAHVLRTYGVEPTAVVGHSQGEIAAACVAGILSLPDAARVVSLRSRLLRERGEAGGMIVVALGPERVRDLLSPWADRLAIAAVNGPESVVVSGEVAALEEFERTLSARRALRLRVPGVQFTAHSAQIDGLEDPLREWLGPIRPEPGDVGIFSTVQCRWLTGTEMDVGYWFRNLRDPVRFEEATRRLVADGHLIFVEVSAHPVLVPGLRETLESIPVPRTNALGLLRRDDGDLGRLLTTVAELHVHGVEVDWPAVFAGHNARCVTSPTAPCPATSTLRRPSWVGTIPTSG
ncbi:MAG: acyltransferase domain-containing protein [Sciscionella sp.]